MSKETKTNIFPIQYMKSKESGVEQQAQTMDFSGLDLGGWDVDSMFRFSEWLEKALEASGAKVTGTGGGLGGRDIWFELEGVEFKVQAKPVTKP